MVDESDSSIDLSFLEDLDGIFDEISSDPIIHHQNPHEDHLHASDSLEFNPKRIKLMGPDQHSQQIKEHLRNVSEESSSPLGLSLRKSPSFLELIESEARRTSPSHEGGKTPRGNQERKSEGTETHPRRPSHFSATLLRIGTWKKVAKVNTDVIAKFYYLRRKLVWELSLNEGQKSKFEMEFSDISAIRAIFAENGHDVLEIELEKAPSFFNETNAQPRNQINWQPSTDFTKGLASIYRRHYLEFVGGTLQKHYRKLLECDQRLHQLSKEPFPSHASPYFDSSHQGYIFQPDPLYHVQSLVLMAKPNPAVEFTTPILGHGGNYVLEDDCTVNQKNNDAENAEFFLSEIEDYLLSDQDVKYPDEQKLMAEMESLRSVI